jgi:chitin disaccharide deacetylase
MANAHGGDKHTRRLCISMDDFGLHGGVCQAGLLLADMGRVNAIGCMVGAPAWSKWAPRLKVLKSSQVDVGLHLDLTEHPLRREPKRLTQLIACSWLRSLSRSSIRTEICVQLDAFEQQMARTPDFVDGHQHVHQFPIVRDELLAELQRRYPGQLPWLRNTRKTPRRSAARGPGWSQAIKPLLISALGSTALTVAGQRSGFRQNNHLLGVHDFTAAVPEYLEFVRGWVHACADGDVLMCHPSLSKQLLDPISEARVTEYQVLSGPAFGALLRDESIVLQALSRTLTEHAARPFRTANGD